MILSDRWPECLCLFGRKAPAVTKSIYKQFERFEFTPIDHICAIMNKIMFSNAL